MGGIGRGGQRARASAALVALAVAVLAAGEAAAGRIRELAREAAPLVLKDGRIAQVGIWAIPFKAKASELEGEVKDELAALLATLATDCFLTAQVIGHVEPEAARAEEALSAHRLARARADRIHRALIERGLQASAIASVWDWQFVVKEPRVTLWVFHLQQGEDCQGKPLEAARAGAPPATTAGAGAEPAKGQSLVAAGEGAKPTPDTAQPMRPSAAQDKAVVGPPLGAQSPEAARENSNAPSPAANLAGALAAPPLPGTRPPPKPVILERANRPAVSGRAGEGAASAAARLPVAPAPASTSTGTTQAARAPASRDEKVAAASPAPPSPGAAARTAQAPSAAATDGAGAARSAPAASAAAATDGGKPVAPEETAAAKEGAREPPQPEREVRPAAGPGPIAALEIHFEANSSFFPKGTAQRLRDFLAALPASGTIELELEAAMGEAEAEGMAKSEGARRWLAEQRVARVIRWLEENAGKRSLRFSTSFREDEPGRRVVLRVKSGA